ncbi:hypothetical protein FHS34_007648 [Streptomyces echinatus]|uniref:Uncharacterized protein n=1 Tax=Streptomyces echinatus TaxID=67293 RepID=A0A7W9Q2H0_9ACTN|nr:hypothetical protein [Streptomyces echinatus]
MPGTAAATADPRPAGAGYFTAQPCNSRRYADNRGPRGSDRPFSQFFTVCVVDLITRARPA